MIDKQSMQLQIHYVHYKRCKEERPLNHDIWVQVLPSNMIEGILQVRRSIVIDKAESKLLRLVFCLTKTNSKHLCINDIFLISMSKLNKENDDECKSSFCDWE